MCFRGLDVKYYFVLLDMHIDERVTNVFSFLTITAIFYLRFGKTVIEGFNRPTMCFLVTYFAFILIGGGESTFIF